MRYFVAALLAVAAAGIFHQDARGQDTAAGTVSALQGTALAVRGDAELPLAAGDAVFGGDILETAAGSKLQVTFVDGTALTLGPAAEVVIDDFVYNPEGGGNTAALRVTAGAARVLAGALEEIGGREAINVSTPVASIGIRGTDFFIEMDGGHLSVALFSGYEIAVTNAGGTTVLRPGEGTDVWETRAPTQPLTWSTERVNRALALVTVSPGRRPLPYAAPMARAETFGEALTGGDIKLDTRYRYEVVDQASQPRDAFASTLRLRLGYETMAYNGLFAGIEGEITRDIGGNRRSAAPAPVLIADPESEELNQAYVGWTMPGGDAMAGSRAVIGRQRIVYDNERWVGAVAFRQNDQTFDALTLETRELPGLALRYAYVDRVNRVLGNNPGGRWQSDSHLFSATTDAVPFGLVTAYAYLLDLKPVPTMSSATYGVRFDSAITGAGSAFNVEAEIARQADYAANPNDYGLTYWLLRPSYKWNGTTVFAGWERLGGNGAQAVQTPLATLHRHNGWADVFLTTPPAGLRDLHVRLLQELPDMGHLKNGKLDLRYHDFASDGGGIDYGTELDADINFSVLGYATVGARFARYDTDGFGPNTTKAWFYVEVMY